MPISNAIDAALVKIADNFTRNMKAKLDAGNYPHGNADRGATSIQDATSIGTVSGNDTTRMIEVSISLKNAPYAAAYEWGSGLHGEKGAKYEIVPKNAPALAFPKEDWPNYEPPPEAPDVFVFNVVHHPGIQPKPYIRPAMQDTRQENLQIAAKEFKTAILLELKSGRVMK